MNKETKNRAEYLERSLNNLEQYNDRLFYKQSSGDYKAYKAMQNELKTLRRLHKRKAPIKPYNAKTDTLITF